MPAVSGLTVAPARKQGGPVLAFALEAPANGASVPGPSFEVRGWVVGAAGPVATVQAVAGGRVLAETTVDLLTPELPARVPAAGPWAAAAGFALAVDTLGLEPAFEIRLRAAAADGRPIARLGVVRGQRAPLAPDSRPRLNALLVTSIGRTGSTLLMRLLSGHPEIVAYHEHPYEMRAAKYWIHLLKTLASTPDPALRVGRPLEFHLDPASAGMPLLRSAAERYPAAAAWAQSDYLDDLAGFCLRSIDGWYERIGAAQGQPAPAFWAEKTFPDEYAELARELYPDHRELVLVRDFRDMWTSMRAYNARLGYGDFGRERAASDELWLNDLRVGAAQLAETAARRGERARVVRYEDLVLRPDETLAEILGYLGLEASPRSIAAMRAAAAEDQEEHRTAASIEASIGRWRRDLDAGQQALARAAFDDLLPGLGYDPE